MDMKGECGGQRRHGVPRLPGGVSMGRDGSWAEGSEQAARDRLATAGIEELSRVIRADPLHAALPLCF